MGEEAPASIKRRWAQIVDEKLLFLELIESVGEAFKRKVGKNLIAGVALSLDKIGWDEVQERAESAIRLLQHQEN
jgi:hypothetical protein